jgi:hypothetical protein
MSDAHILFSIENAIATITLNRPDKLNAITLAMLDQYGNESAFLAPVSAERIAQCSADKSDNQQGASRLSTGESFCRRQSLLAKPS